MGTWGTAMHNNDAFADIYSEFFRLYNKGEIPELISKQIIETNQEMLEIEEEKHNFWFALALAQWETKSLDPNVLEIVEIIINTGADIELWNSLGATEKDISKRKDVLTNFLRKIKSERSKAKPRKKPKLKTPIFSTGDCLTFMMKNGNYGGAIILASDTNPETGYNLVVTTRINQKQKPTISDFEKSEVLVLNYANWDSKANIVWCAPDLYTKKFSDIYELVGKISVELLYDSRNYEGKNYLFHPLYTSDWRMNINAEMQFESELTKEKPSKTITIHQLTKKRKWWKINIKSK